MKPWKRHSRPVLSLKRKQTIMEFRENWKRTHGPEDATIMKTALWQEKLFEFMHVRERVVQFSDVTRWISVHKWITDPNQEPPGRTWADWKYHRLIHFSQPPPARNILIEPMRRVYQPGPVNLIRTSSENGNDAVQGPPLLVNQVVRDERPLKKRQTRVHINASDTPSSSSSAGSVAGSSPLHPSLLNHVNGYANGNVAAGSLEDHNYVPVVADNNYSNLFGAEGMRIQQRRESNSDVSTLSYTSSQQSGQSGRRVANRENESSGVTLTYEAERNQATGAETNTNSSGRAAPAIEADHLGNLSRALLLMKSFGYEERGATANLAEKQQRLLLLLGGVKIIAQKSRGKLLGIAEASNNARRCYKCVKRVMERELRSKTYLEERKKEEQNCKRFKSEAVQEERERRRRELLSYDSQDEDSQSQYVTEDDTLTDDDSNHQNV